jgi:hypothetical protein
MTIKTTPTQKQKQKYIYNNLSEEYIQFRHKILDFLLQQGFIIEDNGIRPAQDTKEHYRKMQSMAKLQQLPKQQEFIRRIMPLAMKYCRNGEDIIPEDIRLELQLVKPNTEKSDLFRWWNIVWWNMPYQTPYGRQLRFFLWDITHNSPFGLILLQSPVLRMSVRDKYLGIKWKGYGEDNFDIIINKSLYAQRTGALPPYNDLLGGKMVALSLVSNEIRNIYGRKYGGVQTDIRKRQIDPDLLFITTSSAFGRSSVYDRLKIGNDLIAKMIGYTYGSGSFHIPDNIYREMISFLEKKSGEKVKRRWSEGPSTKIKVITKASKELKLPNISTHGIKREFYIFSLVRNLERVIHHNESPNYIDRPFDDLTAYWKQRWCIPRSHRIDNWKEFKAEIYEKEILKILQNITTGSLINHMPL